MLEVSDGDWGSVAIVPGVLHNQNTETDRTVSTGSFAKLEAVLASSGGPFLMGEHVSGLMLAEAPMYIQMCDEG
eukprot:1445767-Pyramimonas_sp.AAC.1